MYDLIAHMSIFCSNEDAIKKTVEAGGNVLIPVDTAGRVLELILILEEVSQAI